MGSWQRHNRVCGCESKLPRKRLSGGRGVSTLVVAAAGHMFCVRADKDAVNGICWSELFIKDSFSCPRMWRKEVESFLAHRVGERPDAPDGDASQPPNISSHSKVKGFNGVLTSDSLSTPSNGSLPPLWLLRFIGLWR